MLSDLLKKETVQILGQLPDWEEAVKVAAHPLLVTGTIEDSYIDAMITNIKTLGPYVVIHEAHINQIPLHYRPIDEVPKDMLVPKVMFIDEPERLNTIIANIPESFWEKYTFVKSTPFFLEILDPRVSKGNAVKQLAEKLSIKQEEVICIGDGENDLSMIEYAGCGVAMANAESIVKEAAQFHTLSNNENGVAYAIEKLI